MKQPDHAMDAFEEERSPRNSDEWETFNAQPLPAGPICIVQIPGVTPVRLAVDNPEQSAVTYVAAGGEYRATLLAPQTLMFRAEIDPAFDHDRHPEVENPDSQPGTGSDLMTVWQFGNAGSIRFECGYGRFGPPSRNPVRCERSRQPNTRGFCAVDHEPDPKRCVRGKASLDVESGELRMWMQLESGPTIEGPEGNIVVTLWDAHRAKLYEVRVGDCSIGGMSPGFSRVETITARHDVPRELARKTVSVSVVAQRTGLHFGAQHFDVLSKTTTAIRVTFAGDA
jgi:hypothetical protein